MIDVMKQDRMVTPSFCCILAANFLLFMGFYLILPVLPFYLVDAFSTGKSTIGLVLSCYTRWLLLPSSQGLLLSQAST